MLRATEELSSKEALELPFVGSAMKAIRDGEPEIARTAISSIKTVSLLNELLGIAIRRALELPVGYLIKEGADSFWLALAILQEPEVTRKWSKSSYARVFDFLVDELIRAKTPQVVDQEKQDNILQVLKHMVSRGENHYVRRLLALRYLKDITLDELLFEALDVGNGEMVPILAIRRVACVPFALVKMQNFRTKLHWISGSYNGAYHDLIQILGAQEGDSLSVELEEGAEILKLSSIVIEAPTFAEDEKKAFLQALSYMLVHHDNTSIEILLARDVLNQIVKDMAFRRQYGFENLLPQALKAGNGQAVLSLLEYSGIAEVLAGILVMQGFSTRWFWSTGNYEEIYHCLLDAIAKENSGVEITAETRMAFKKVFSHMINKEPNRESKLNELLDNDVIITCLGNELDALFIQATQAGLSQIVGSLLKRPEIDDKSGISALKIVEAERGSRKETVFDTSLLFYFSARPKINDRVYANLSERFSDVDLSESFRVSRVRSESDPPVLLFFVESGNRERSRSLGAVPIEKTNGLRARAFTPRNTYKS